ncbi:AAA family ATPase [Gimibacter soli]|uniref:AAA family ATPase n=1 Tax=Gimibacter soli TaxID=3024400 RepID=A0AAE9XNN1_9PROT|nr:AAA family ATPase [Gimibacter soli]WCL53486.1 AAA family ATPase [Gimibacter soli]
MNDRISSTPEWWWRLSARQLAAREQAIYYYLTMCTDAVSAWSARFFKTSPDALFRLATSFDRACDVSSDHQMLLIALAASLGCEAATNRLIDALEGAFAAEGASLTRRMAVRDRLEEWAEVSPKAKLAFGRVDQALTAWEAVQPAGYLLDQPLDTYEDLSFWARFETAPKAPIASGIQAVQVAQTINPPKSRDADYTWCQSLVQPLELKQTPDLAGLQAALETEFFYARSAIKTVVDALLLRAAHGQAAFRLPPLLLVGPPGVGKTRFARRLAELAGVPSVLHGVGGNSDNRTLAGTAAGWSSAVPSLPAKFMAAEKVANGLLVIDEVEKASRSSRNGSVQNTLLSFLEPESARNYYDECLQGVIDLTNLNWVLIANSEDSIEAPLRSRLRVIEWNGPEPDDLYRLIPAIAAGVAADIGVDPRFFEPLPDSVMDALAGTYGKGRDLRVIRRMVEDLYAADVRRDLAPH